MSEDKCAVPSAPIDTSCPIIPYSVGLQVINRTIARLPPMTGATEEQMRRMALGMKDEENFKRCLLMAAYYGKGSGIDTAE